MCEILCRSTQGNALSSPRVSEPRALFEYSPPSCRVARVPAGAAEHTSCFAHTVSARFRYAIARGAPSRSTRLIVAGLHVSSCSITHPVGVLQTTRPFRDFLEFRPLEAYCKTALFSRLFPRSVRARDRHRLRARVFSGLRSCSVTSRSPPLSRPCVYVSRWATNHGPPRCAVAAEQRDGLLLLFLPVRATTSFSCGGHPPSYLRDKRRALSPSHSNPPHPPSVHGEQGRTSMLSYTAGGLPRVAAIALRIRGTHGPEIRAGARGADATPSATQPRVPSPENISRAVNFL